MVGHSVCDNAGYSGSIPSATTPFFLNAGFLQDLLLPYLPFFCTSVYLWFSVLTSVPHKLSHVLIISPFQHHTLFTTYFFTSKIVHKFVSNIYSKNSIIHTFVQLCNYRYVVRIGVLYLRLWRFCELLTILGEIVIRYFFATF